MRFTVELAEGDMITLRAPHSNYRNTFRLVGGATPAAQAMVRGTIVATARKVEPVSDGGNYVEPLFGRPRRMQGEITGMDAAANALQVQVGYPVTVLLPAAQRAQEFPLGMRVGWDNSEMPTFTLQAAPAAGLAEGAMRRG